MGVYGWNVLANRRKLVGEVTDHWRNDDGDWEFTVIPAPGFKDLLVNSHGKAIREGVGCEVEPTDSVDNDKNEAKFFGPLMHQSVTVEGAWVEDLSHDLKTEIHPIYSILREAPQQISGNQGKRVEFFVFSDDSANFPAKVPFSGQSITGGFEVPYPDPPEDDSVPSFKVVSALNMADSANYSKVAKGSTYSLQGKVQSGVHPDRGFYHGVLDLFYDTSSQMRFAGIWHPGDKSQMFYAGEDFQHFAARLGDLQKQGWHCTSMQRYVSGGRECWAGIWHPGDKSQMFYAGEDFQHFAARLGDLQKQGWHCTSMWTYHE